MATLLLLVIIIALLAFAAWELFGKKSPPPTSTNLRNPPTPPTRSSQRTAPAATQRKGGNYGTDYHWEGKGDFEFEVVGESNYQIALAILAGEHGKEDAEAQHKATLVLDDSNPHDPKAVAIRIDEIPVGYLAREDARSYRRRLGQKSLSGVNATCEAIVVGGGTRRNGEKLHYGVKLDIKPF